MGVVVSKKTKERTKKVHQTTTVVTALKLGNSNRVQPQTSSKNNTSVKSTEQFNRGINASFRERPDESKGLNTCKDSLTYGLPSLRDSELAVTGNRTSGTTGYWNQSSAKGVENGQIPTIPYFGAWHDRVGCNSSPYACILYIGQSKTRIPKM